MANGYYHNDHRIIWIGYRKRVADLSIFFLFFPSTFSPVVLHLKQFVENVVDEDGDGDSIEMFHVTSEISLTLETLKFI